MSGPSGMIDNFHQDVVSRAAEIKQLDPDLLAGRAAGNRVKFEQLQVILGDHRRCRGVDPQPGLRLGGQHTVRRHQQRSPDQTLGFRMRIDRVHHVLGRARQHAHVVTQYYLDRGLILIGQVGQHLDLGLRIIQPRIDQFDEDRLAFQPLSQGFHLQLSTGALIDHC